MGPDKMMPASSDTRPFEVDVFLQDGFEMTEISAITEIIGDLKKTSPTIAIDLRVTSSKGGNVLAADGFCRIETVPLRANKGAGLLILVGSIQPNVKVLSAVFSSARAHGRYTLVLSGAVVALQKRGAFSASKVCMPWSDVIDTGTPDGNENWVDRIYAIGPNFATCAGRFSTPHALLSVLSDRFGMQTITTIAERSLLGSLRSANARQRISARDRYRIENPNVVYLIEHFEGHFAEQLSMPEVAEMLGLSTRQVERLCRAELGRSPTRLLEDIRVRWVWWYLEHSAMPITEIAYTCGFGSPSHLAKVFRRRYDKTPRFFREHAFQSALTPFAATSLRVPNTLVSQSGSISGTDDSNNSV